MPAPHGRLSLEAYGRKSVIAPPCLRSICTRNLESAYQNAWFFTDYNYGRLRAMTLDATGQAVLSETVFHDQPGAGYAVTMGPDGNLWYLTILRPAVRRDLLHRCPSRRRRCR